MKDFRHSKGTTMPGKGEYGGFCNRSACLAPNPTWFNQSTRAFYCSHCAHLLNSDRFNAQFAREAYGDPRLCIQVSHYRSSVPGVIRYVVTYIGKDGLRTLAHAAQGHHTYATPSEARQWIADALKNNSADTLASVYGDVSKLEVRPCECWPGHFDPKGIYFDTEEEQCHSAKE